MHMISKKDLSDAEMDTLTKSCSPTIVTTANGEVQTHEEAIVYVKELDIFLTMKVLENTPAVLSLGKLCDEKTGIPTNGSMVKNHISSKTGFGYLVILRTSFLSWFQACQVRPLDLHQLHRHLHPHLLHLQQAEIPVREREDAPNSDISPVPVSVLVDDRTGKPEEIQANEIQKTNKKETTIKR